ncbi:PREDICTED: uncharacterized protein C6orf118 homolog, partial [Cariama cristata]|uniref:uncharacterized protein C6orf118 homolog n=1 Tax=Cariama cristata TaxID=54380 RepID=UPI00051FF73C
MLKKKPVKNSQQCVEELAKEEYQFIPSYLAGATKTEQFDKLLRFQKEFVAKHELLQNDFTGSEVVEEVFEDVCNNSLISDDILKEVK